MNVNIGHVVYLLKAMIEPLLNRSGRSAVVITSSISAALPLPTIAMYGASKVFEKYLAEAINYEERNNLDVISYEPGYVCSNLSKLSNANSDTITA